MIQTLVILAAALLPAILLGLYIWKKDPHPEPTKELIKAVIGGVLISIPVVVIETLVQNTLFGGGEPTTLIGSTLQAFFVAALPEEGAKLFVLWLLLRNNKHFDEHFDGIVYAVFISLGFAAIENVGYVFGSGEDWMSTAVVRAFLAVPGHYADAILMGYFYALYHFVDKSRKNYWSILLMPVLAHGVYDSIAFSGSINPLLGGISFFVLVFFCIRLQKFAQNKVLDLVAKNKAADAAKAAEVEVVEVTEV